jgi:hypothetical protein
MTVRSSATAGAAVTVDCCTSWRAAVPTLLTAQADLPASVCWGYAVHVPELGWRRHLPTWSGTAGCGAGDPACAAPLRIVSSTALAPASGIRISFEAASTPAAAVPAVPEQNGVVGGFSRRLTRTANCCLPTVRPGARVSYNTKERDLLKRKYLRCSRAPPL